MTNKERYRKAFSTLHASGTISLEEEHMEKRIRCYRLKRAAAACAAAAVVCGSMTVAYAADLGGIQQKMMAWFHGEQTQINVRRTGENSYSYTYTDEKYHTDPSSITSSPLPASLSTSSADKAVSLPLSSIPTAAPPPFRTLPFSSVYV